MNPNKILLDDIGDYDPEFTRDIADWLENRADTPMFIVGGDHRGYELTHEFVSRAELMSMSVIAYPCFLDYPALRFDNAEYLGVGGYLPIFVFLQSRRGGNKNKERSSIPYCNRNTSRY